MSFKRLFTSAAVALILAGGSLAPAMAADDHIINMQDVDIKAFIENVGIVTGRTFVIDPRVNGKVNIVSEKPLNDIQVFGVFKEVLRVHGYTVIRAANGEYRVTLLQGAAQDAPFSESGSGISGQFSTVVLRVDNGKAAEAARLIKPVMHSQGQVSANPDGDVVVVTDFAENLRKARAIVSAMGVGGDVRETVQLTQLSVRDAEDALKQLGGTKAPYKVVALEATNSLILEGPAAEIAELRRLLASMDVGSSVPRGAVSVVPVQFALGGINGSTIPLLSSNFSRQAGNLLNVVGAIGADDVGLSDVTQTAFQSAAIDSLAGIDGGAFGIGGTSNDALFGLIVNALETGNRTNRILHCGRLN